MKTRRIVLVALLTVVSVLTWRVGVMLSDDAVGMAIGLLLGVLAGAPLAWLVLFVAGRNTQDGAQ